MLKRSAGILIYKKTAQGIDVLLAHPGGPFWSKKDTWSIPKGETEPGEELHEAARREFKEEMGFDPPGTLDSWIDLGETKQESSKTNHIWAVEGDVETSKFKCESTFNTEWPPKSGIVQEFPENDRIAWLPLAIAKQKVFKAQQSYFDRLAEFLKVDIVESPQQTSLL